MKLFVATIAFFHLLALGQAASSSYSSVGKGKGKGSGYFDEENFDEDRYCSSHDKCAYLGLTGLCCATEDGVYLDCCDKKSDHIDDDRKCSSHDKCADLGLTGLCCATEDGVYLDCCDKDSGYGKGKGKGAPTHPYPAPKPSYKPTPHPTNKPTPKPVYKPTDKPTYKPTPKPTPYTKPVPSSSSSAKGKGKGGKGQTAKSVEDSPSCRNTVFYISQYWDGPIIEPDGTKVDGPGSASVKAGQSWSFVNHVYDFKEDDYYEEEHKDNKAVGSNAELCIRLNDGDIWHCEGTYLDLYACHGQLSFAGPFSDDANVGKYTVTGGTGDFDGATGYIVDEFSYDTHYSMRTIYIK